MDEMIERYRKEAAKGDSYSQAMLGNAYFLAGKYKEALPWLILAGEQDEQLALMILGDMYYSGKGVEKSGKEAIKWFKKAAAQGNIAAEGMIGIISYFEGNYNEAVKYLVQAEAHGSEQAKMVLGFLKNAK